ncbi:MAG: DUF3021 domain-containing protein [Defluviitaleaceae bacterium]|nr:DUF3021 domain-containing protein [Defluviitaleaceae bacterium]
MDVKEIRRLILDSFFVVFGCAVLSTHVFKRIDGGEHLPSYYIAVLFIAALIICVSNFVFYSKRVLTRRQMSWRYLLHFVITLAVAAVVGVYMEWIVCSSPIWVLLYLLIVSIFYGLMLVVNEMRYYGAVKEMNEQLKKRFNQ